MNDEEKDAVLREIETRCGIVAALCRDADSSDTYETLWCAFAEHANQGLCIWVVGVEGVPFAVLSRRPLTEGEVAEWVAAMELEVED